MVIDKDKTEKLLIVDDVAVIRDFFVDAFGERFDCRTASSSAEARELLSRESFDLIFCDIDLGDESGLKLIPAIISALPHSVVIVVSGDLSEDNIKEAKRAGAFDFIAKPLDLKAMETVVEKALFHIRSKRDVGGHGPEKP